MTDDLHPGLRVELELRQDAGVHHRARKQRTLDAIARSRARGEWPRLDLPAPAGAERAGDVREWACAIAEVALLDGLDPGVAENLVALREWYVENFRPDQL